MPSRLKRRRAPPQRRRLAPEHVLCHVGYRHLAAEPAHGLRHLDSHRPVGGRGGGRSAGRRRRRSGRRSASHSPRARRQPRRPPAGARSRPAHDVVLEHADRPPSMTLQCSSGMPAPFENRSSYTGHHYQGRLGMLFFSRLRRVDLLPAVLDATRTTPVREECRLHRHNQAPDCTRERAAGKSSERRGNRTRAREVGNCDKGS
jgi:hypothetical protein